MYSSTLRRSSSANNFRRPGFGSLLKGAPRPMKFFFGLVATFMVTVIAITIFMFSQHMVQVNTYADCTVNSVHYAIDSEGFETYRVLSSCGTFTANGDLRYGTISGAGMVSRLVEGETYTFTATGMNQPNMGIVPNIVEIVAAAR